MRTVTFQSVLHGVATRLGLDPENGLTPQDASAVTEYINKRVRISWESYPWPELMVTEERFYRAAWDAGTTYAINAEVYDAATWAYYISQQADNTGHLVSDTAWWLPVSTLDKYVAHEQAGLTPIGEVFGVSSTNPYLFRRRSRLGYGLSKNGIQLEHGAPAGVWIEYRLRPNEFSASVWDSTRIYAAKEIVYDAPHCYRALLATEPGDLTSDATKWVLVPMPWILSEYVKHAAYADALREDGQSDKALMEERIADRLLELEAMKIAELEGSAFGYGAVA